ncbi:MAG: amidohydrolase [Chitinivibrionales bacterium]|nr:amidohydrolase [Chitinivibrionales bacterium]
MQDLDALSNKIYPDIVKVRRHIHAFPELSGREYNTAQFIYHQLLKAGLSPRFYAEKRGVAATLKNGRGKTIVLRADCDALPISEKTRISYRSKNDGIMHACGHDMHTAALIGAARVLNMLRGRISGTVVFLFQPAEETEPGGALQMIREGAFPRNTDACFALHVSPDLPVGKIGLLLGYDCAGVTDFDIVVTGKGGHGATPHACVDPIVCAASIVVAAQSLISRVCPASESAVVSIGEIHCGSARNIIADEAVLKGTLRAFNPRLAALLTKRLNQLCMHIARAHNAKARLIIRQGYPAGYNNPALTNRIRRVLERSFAKGITQTVLPTLFGEDFAYYQQAAPGVILHVGVADARKKKTAGLHSAVFLPQEAALKTMIKTHAAIALDMLAK